ncbi:MAG: LysM peptidoglycan-binding domain-containing protein [Candidatus Zixiibacteriota bacterium]
MRQSSRFSGEHEGYELYQTANEAYTDGALHNLHREWDDAIEDFDRALMEISQIEISTQGRELQDKVAGLLNEIAYDYRIALSNTDNTGSANATAIISMALDEDGFPNKTKRELSKLLNQLPSEPRGDFDIPITWNEVVGEKILLFQSDSYQEKMTEWLSRSTRYLPMIKRVFREEAVPLDLAYLPLVESGFNTKAYSWAKASGIWQFIAGTGRQYGLDIDWWVDERRDPEKSTRAAAKYLKTLYGMFGDWELALASYNCGENRVKRILHQKAANSFWEIREFLPRETRNYVPLYTAALIIAKNPQKYGFYPEYQTPEYYDIVRLVEPVNLELAAEVCGVSEDEITKLNSELLRWCTPNKSSYDLKVPKGSARGFHSKYSRIPESRKSVWQKHKVKHGESLSLIAHKYGTSISALVKANQISNQHKLSIGQTLMVPVKSTSSPSKVASAVSQSKKSSSRSKNASPPSSSSSASTVKRTSNYSGESGTYKVKRGDTPSEIADKYGISLTSLYNANDMNRRSVIRVGQALNIPIDNLTSGSGSYREYTVRQGDTPLHIAVQNNMTLNEFLTLNDMDKNGRIYPGQKLKVKGGSGNKAKITHKVKTGESLWSIAKKYNVRVSDIVYWNGYGSNSPVLQPGDKVAIMTENKSADSDNLSSKQKTYHTVRAGDNLWKIANKYDVSIDELKSWNNKRSSSLAIGDKLAIYMPKKESGKPKPSTGKQIIHRVQNGDTLWDIAQKYNTTPTEIMNQNQLADPSELKIGDELRIFIN